MASAENTIDPVARFNFRLPASIKKRIEKAAIASGLTVTDFAINVLAESAEEVLEKHHNRVLSDRDRDIFLNMLENPPKPNAALLKAFEDHKKRVKNVP